MGTVINKDAYANFNASFGKFVESPAVKGSTIAKIDQFTLSGVNKLEAGEGDYKGNLFRDAAQIASNNRTRTIFKKSVADIFGGENKIPNSVKAAMKWDDFDGKGRPLTARRIKAVRDAIFVADLESRMKTLVDGMGESSKNVFSAIENFTQGLLDGGLLEEIPDNLKHNGACQVIKSSCETAKTKLANVREALKNGTLTPSKLSAEVNEILTDLDKAINNNAYKLKNSNDVKRFNNDCKIKEAGEGLKKPAGQYEFARGMLKLQKAFGAKEMLKLPAFLQESIMNRVAKNPVTKDVDALLDRFIRLCTNEKGVPSLDALKKFEPTENDRRLLTETLSRNMPRNPGENEDTWKARVGRRSENILSSLATVGMALMLEGKVNPLSALVDKFCKNPAIQAAIGTQYNPDVDLQSFFKTKIKDSVDAVSNQKLNHERGFNADGIRRLTLREYDLGFVKCNGENISDKPFLERNHDQKATNDSRMGFEDWLISTFDDTKLGMRKLISTLVGMTDGVFNVDEDAFAGVGGAPTMKTDNGQEINVLKGRTWNDPKNLMEQPNLKFSPGANDKSRNSYDVQIGKDGGVTLKCERYLTTHVKQMGDSDGSPLNLSIGEEADGIKILDYKVVTVVTISPEQMAAVKLEQGEIPDFSVKSVTTEFV